MRPFYLSILAGFLIHLISPVVQAETVVPYPDKAHQLFNIVAPNRWTVARAEASDDYVTLEGPTGTVYFRATEGPLDKAILGTQEELESSYSNLKLGPKETMTLDGLPATFVKGTGTSTEDRSRYSVGVAWTKLPGGKIAEIWYEIPTDNVSGILRATEIIKSLKIRKDAPADYTLELAMPQKEIEKVDDTHDFPYALPFPGAKFEKTTVGPEPFAAILPGAKSATTKSYSLPSAISSSQVLAVYSKALEAAGWSMISGVVSDATVCIAHFDRSGRDLWLYVRVNGSHQSISVFDNAAVVPQSAQ